MLHALQCLQKSSCRNMLILSASVQNATGSSRWLNKLLVAGPQNQHGLQLQSFRIDGGLEARIQLPKTYQAFPGIMNGGAVGGLFDCHGNWTAAIALMDHSSLPKPPLTLTTEVLVKPSYKESMYRLDGSNACNSHIRATCFSLPSTSWPMQYRLS